MPSSALVNLQLGDRPPVVPLASCVTSMLTLSWVMDSSWFWSLNLIIRKSIDPFAYLHTFQDFIRAIDDRKEFKAIVFSWLKSLQ